MKIQPVIKENALIPRVFNALREEFGISQVNEADVKVALDNDLYDVVAFDDYQPVGMARLVGDGKLAFYIKDVYVLRSYQGKGIGGLLIKRLIDYYDLNHGETSYLGLMSTCGSETFYEHLGFEKRPNQRLGSGMILIEK